MSDKDLQMLEEAYENIFSGKIEEEDEEKKDLESSEDSDKEEDSEDSEDSDKEESSDDSEDSEDSEEADDSDDSDDGESEDSGDSESSSGGGDAGIKSKIEKLQKQYNDILVDAFEKYAPECIENALNDSGSSFGDNIQDILQNALDELRGKILDDLGVEADAIGIGGMEVDMGNDSDVQFGAEVGGIPTITVGGEDQDDQADGGCSMAVAPEEGSDESSEDEDEDEVEEGCSKKHGKKKVMKESFDLAEFYGFVD